MISTNPGEPLRRLEHIASGGELSRVMLALKASVEAEGRWPDGKKKGSWRSADVGLRRNRYGNWRTCRRSGRQKTQRARPHQPGAMRYTSSADRHFRRPSLPDREEGVRRTHENLRPQHHRQRADRRSRPHAKRGEGHRELAKACRADDQGECLSRKKRKRAERTWSTSATCQSAVMRVPLTFPWMCTSKLPPVSY